MEKGIHALAAFFGTIYAGGFYVMLEPSLPGPRLMQIQSVLEASVIIADEASYISAQKLFRIAGFIKLKP